MENLRQKAVIIQNALSALSLEPKISYGSRFTEKILVGKVLSTRVFKRFTFTEIINRIWKLKVKVHIEKVGENIFKLCFLDKSDRDIFQKALVA